MPCMDGGPSPDQLAEATAKIHRVTRLLCEVMGMVADKGYPFSDEVVAWWEQHQRDDAQRIRREQAAATNAQRRRDAFAKLTPEERRILGIAKHWEEP